MCLAEKDQIFDHIQQGTELPLNASGILDSLLQVKQTQCPHDGSLVSYVGEKRKIKTVDNNESKTFHHSPVCLL